MWWVFALPIAGASDRSLFHKLIFESHLHTTAPRPTNHLEYQYSRLPPSILRQPGVDETFDYIIVGGGGAGCPLARTLADAGFRTLLLERGGLREHHPVTWDMYGSGATLMDTEVSQPIVTQDGYVSHIAHVLGGGTAVNLGFYVEGNDEGFTRQFKYSYLWKAATKWVRRRVGHATKHKDRYYEPLLNFTESLTEGNSTLQSSPEYLIGKSWNGRSIFSPNDDFRTASDTLLGPISEFPRSLVLSIKSTVTKVVTERDLTTRLLNAKCVEYRDTITSPVALLGKREGIVGGLQNELTIDMWFNWYPHIRKFLGSLFASNDALRSPPIKRVCLNDNPNSEIILSSGAIMSPGILYQSGIGPEEETSKLGIPNILNLIHLGRHLGDRIFLPIAFFFQEHIQGMFEPSIVQRMALYFAKPGFKSQPKLQQTEDENSSWNQATVPTRMSELDKLLAFDSPVLQEASTDTTPVRDHHSLTWEEIAQMGDLRIDEGRGKSRNSPPFTSDNAGFIEHLSGMEEISGGLMTTGASIATRYFFPPALRSSIAVDVVLETLFGCTAYGHEDGTSGVLKLCPLVRPILECMHKTAALVYLLPEPQSRGRVTIGGADGKSVTVLGNYLQDPMDRDAGTVGLADLLRGIEAYKAFDDVFEFSGSASQSHCTGIVRDHLADLLFRVTKLLVPYVSTEEAEEAAHSLRYSGLKELESAIEANNNTLQEEALLHALAKRKRKQQYASFPPRLPDPSNYEETKQFLLRHATSMWHWYGSASIGHVVNDELRVPGVKRLGIIDASVLQELPKMNPQVTVMSLGRYGGMIRLVTRRT